MMLININQDFKSYFNILARRNIIMDIFCSCMRIIDLLDINSIERYILFMNTVHSF